MQEQFDALSLHRVGVSGRELTGVSGQTERFTQVRQLGEGSSCITYLALNSDGHRAVIKELYPRKLRRLYQRQSDGSLKLPERMTLLDRKRIEKAQEAFVREYFWQRELQQSNSFTGGNSPLLYLSGDSLYNVMTYDGEQVTGEEMGDFVRDCLRQDPPVDYVRVILSELRNYAEELANAHDMGCLVSDIKPGNLLITRSGWALSYRRMIDYGSIIRFSDINAIAPGTATDPSVFSYTQEFAAPEVLRKEYAAVGPWSDVYSFGMTVLTLLLGSSISNPANLLSQNAANFRRVILECDRYGAISERDAGFMARLGNFCRYTLAAGVMASDIRPEEAFSLVQSEQSPGLLRVRSMRCVVRMIDALLDCGDAAVSETEVRRRARLRARTFSENYYGMTGEREHNRELFSEQLLPLLQTEGKTLPFAALTQKGTDDSLLDGRISSVYIEGKSGAGKTTALQFLVCRAAETEGAPVPVWISLADLFLAGEGDKEKLLRGCVAERLFGAPDYAEIARRHDEELERYLAGEGARPPLLLIFDGLNEASLCGSDVSEWLRAIRTMCSRPHVISVFSGHDQAVEFPMWKGRRMNVLPCPRETASGYLGHLTAHLRNQDGTPRFHWHPGQLSAEVVDRTLRFLDSPMLLHYFALRYLDIPIDASQLPRNKALLIEQYLTRLGRNCAMDRVHRLIAGESMQTDIPFGYFLMSSVAGGVCLSMLENRSLSVSAKEIRTLLDSRLSVVRQPDGTVTRAIGNQYISSEAYNRMISFDSDGENGGSWISHFFVSRASGKYSVIHETIGVYLAARFLADVIKRAGSTLPPNAFLRHDLPEELLSMTAMLLEYSDMKALRSGIKKIYGGPIKRFVVRQFKDLTGRDDVLLNNEFRAYDIETTGHYFHRMVEMMDNLSRWERFRLLWGMPDNKVKRSIDSFFTRTYKKGGLSDLEKERLGSAMKSVTSQSDVLAVARLLWEKHPGMSFKSDLDVLLKACEELSEYTADLLEKHGVLRSAAEPVAALLLGGETIIPDEDYVKEFTARLICSMDCADESAAASAVELIYERLDEHRLLKICPRLRNVWGAELILGDVQASFEAGQYSGLLTRVLSDELIAEVSRLAFFNFSEVHESFYPEKWHEALLKLKPEIFRSYAAKKASGEEFRLDVEGSVNYTDPAQQLIVQFCAVEYEIMSSPCVNGFYRMNQEQFNALTQLFLIINYVLCDGHIGRMGSSLLQFEEDGILGKAVCGPGVSSGGRMSAVVAMITLGMDRDVPEREFYRFLRLYAKDYRFLHLNHLDKKSVAKLIGLGLLLMMMIMMLNAPEAAYSFPFFFVLLLPVFYFLLRLYLLVIDLISHTVRYFRINMKVVMVLFVLAHLPVLGRLTALFLSESWNLFDVLRDLLSFRYF